MQKVGNSLAIEMTGDIGTRDNSDHTSRRVQGARAPNSGRSLGVSSVTDMSVASSFYGGGVTVTGGPPDETFKDEYGNECTKYVNRTIIINEHMAVTAETRNHKGIDIGTPNKNSALRNRAIVFLFVASTIILLLFVLLDVGGGRNSQITDKEDKLAAAMGFNAVDDWDDDDDSEIWDSYTKSALEDDTT